MDTEGSHGERHRGPPKNHRPNLRSHGRSPAKTLCLSFYWNVRSFPVRLREIYPKISANSSKDATALTRGHTRVLPSGWASAEAPSLLGSPPLRGWSPHQTVTS